MMWRWSRPSKSPAESAQQKATRLINDEAAIARLREHLVGAGHTRAVRVLPIAVATDREYGNVVGPRVGAQTATELDTVDAWYRNVGEDEIGIHFERLVQRLMAVVGLLDKEAVTLQYVGVELPRLGIVFDDQNEGRRRRRVAARGHRADDRSLNLARQAQV